MLLHPFYSIYDMDDSYDSSPWTSSEQLRRRQQQQAYYNELAQRERLRQVEMERERQYRRKVEEDRRRRQQAAMLQYLHRQKQAEEYRQRLGNDRLQQTMVKETAPDRDPTNGIGSNSSTPRSEGQSFRIPVRIVRNKVPFVDQSGFEKMQLDSNSTDVLMDTTDSFEKSIPVQIRQEQMKKINDSLNKDNKQKARTKRQKAMVLVEDASDSENEDDDLKSIWRNRRPSPGQWMEPIDFY